MTLRQRSRQSHPDLSRGRQRFVVSDNASSCRRGFTLLEVIIALSMTAALAAVSVRGFRSVAVQSVANANSARSLALDLTRVRRLAIQSGLPHGIRLQRERGRIAGYITYRRTVSGALQVIADGNKDFPIEASVTTSRRDIEFRIDGSVEHSSRLQFDAGARRWQISIPIATGRPLVEEEAL